MKQLWLLKILNTNSRMHHLRAAQAMGADPPMLATDPSPTSRPGLGKSLKVGCEDSKGK